MATYTKLINGLSDLGMHKMQEHLDFYIDLVNKGEKSFSQALEELIEAEQQNNQLRAENACVKTAAFPFIKTMDEFDFSFQPSINKKQLLELNNLGFIDKKENILFVGSSGVGKTHLATSIGITCARSRVSTYFIPFESLITQLKKALLPINCVLLHNHYRYYVPLRLPSIRNTISSSLYAFSLPFGDG